VRVLLGTNGRQASSAPAWACSQCRRLRHRDLVEGLGDGDDGLSDIQAAFVAEGGVQCGFAPRALWSAFTTCSNTILTPTELEVREAVSGNLCRCTGYGRILAAVKAAQETRRG